MAKMVPKIVKRAGTLNRHLRVHHNHQFASVQIDTMYFVVVLKLSTDMVAYLKSVP